MMSLKTIAKRLILCSVFIFIIVMIAYSALPKPEIKRFIPYSSAYFDDQGTLLRLNLATDGRYRLYQPLESMAPAVINATVLYEDQHYYQHIGVDFIAILRAAWDTYIKKSRRIGASTITMQFARLRWKIASNSARGKVSQILRAVQLQRHYSKHEILEAYLNIAPYGGNIEGVGAASLIYFNKPASELNLSEALTLAVIPQNPNRRNPSVASNRSTVTQARLRLSQRWLEQYPADKPKAKQLELPLAIRSISELPFHAPHFVNHINQQHSQWEHGVINTTLNLQKQRKIETVMKRYVEEKANLGIKNAAALLLNYETMRVEAMVGSTDFHNVDIQGQVNGVTAKRSPGSTLKPFVYGLAIDEGIIHPLTLLKDSPRRFGGFTPENYDKQFWGPISAKDALIESRNVPAVDLQAQLKNRSFHQFLKQVGISDLKHEQHYGLALALGGGEVSMLELTSMYAMLANQGRMRSIQTHQPKSHAGSKQQTIDSQNQSLLSKEASFLILDMLKDNPPPEGFERFSNHLTSNQIAWKTGTSWAFRDAWSVGVSGPYVLAVWVGNFDGAGNESFIGRSAAAPLLFSLFRAINKDEAWKVEDLVQSELNLKEVDVCAATGDLYEKYCDTKTLTWFIPGVSPIKVSNVYRRIPIDKKTGLRTCAVNSDRDTEMQTFEFWPSDFLQIFKQAGISLKTPPAYLPDCSLSDKSYAGQQPVISSPQESLEYKINMASLSDRVIPLKAIADSDVSTLHWFVDNSYLGSAQTNDALVWEATPGSFDIHVVDDSGRTASKKVTVTQIQ